MYKYGVNCLGTFPCKFKCAYPALDYCGLFYQLQFLDCRAFVCARMVFKVNCVCYYTERLCEFMFFILSGDIDFFSLFSQSIIFFYH